MEPTPQQTRNEIWTVEYFTGHGGSNIAPKQLELGLVDDSSRSRWICFFLLKMWYEATSRGSGLNSHFGPFAIVFWKRS